ncbi:MAG: 50S ribosomal protein L9 [Candidatus Omnitrophica bacterium CG1_02_49_16]|nr:MAG: 50S ribosomal protein L9 [Candidatus Omnitrophica bacterium CG1_02_49_16]
MEVVLTESDPKLGQRGQVIRVSAGYAHNYLIPHKKAALATASSLKNFEEEKVRHIKALADRKAQAQTLADKILSLSLTLEVLAGEAEKLFGAVTAQDIHEGLLSRGIAVDKKDIQLPEPIKKLGAYTVSVRLHPEVQVKLKLWVVKKKD